MGRSRAPKWKIFETVSKAPKQKSSFACSLPPMIAKFSKKLGGWWERRGRGRGVVKRVGKEGRGEHRVVESLRNGVGGRGGEGEAGMEWGWGAAEEKGKGAKSGKVVLLTSEWGFFGQLC